MKRNKPKREFRISHVELGGFDGMHFTPIGRVTDFNVNATPMPRRIKCYPVPGNGVVNYEPDWFGLTEFG